MPPNLPAAIAWALSYASDLEKSAKDVDVSPGLHDWCKEYAAHLRALVEAAVELERVREDARQVLLTFSEIARDCKDMTLQQVDSMAKAINKILYWPTPPA